MLNAPRELLTAARARHRSDGERGQILVLFTLVIVILMVSAAIVIDVGLLRTDTARLQNALDAGALAAADSLPATSGNIAAVESTARGYVQANYAGVAAPDTSFRCIIGADPSGAPRLIDMPAVCNVAQASTWTCTANVCWAPCDPRAHSTDVCNTVVLKDSAVRPYTFGRVVGVNSGSTGTLQSAACTGACGPTSPLDAVLTIDRTGSMRTREQLLADGARAVLEAWDPDIQHVALGMIGPSSQLTACSTGAYGRILENGTLTSPPIASVQSAANANGGAASLVINRPTSTSADDLLVAGITVDGGSGTSVTAPAGWTQIRRTDNGTNVTVVSFWKLAGASEPNSYSFTLSPNARAVGGILRVTGVDTADPIDLSGGNTGNSRDVQAPSITTTSNRTTLIGFFGTDTRTSFNDAASMTEQFDRQHGNSAGPTLAGDSDPAASTGATTSRIARAGASAQWAAQMIAIRPEPVESYPVGYPTTTPAYTDTFLRDNMSKWIPVGLTGTSHAEVIESYKNADGTYRASSMIAKAIGCVLPPNDLYNGTDQASPFDFARRYLLDHGRAGVPTGIIFETDGTPQLQNYTCQQAQTAASAAKASGIEVYVIGFFASNSPGTRCPDSSGTWRNRTIVQSLAAMATNSSTTSSSSCDANENTDGDHFFCTPDPGSLADVFRAAAVALSGGSRLVQLYPQPIVTSVSGSSGSAGGGSVTISGKYFTEAYSVTFGGTPARSFTVTSDTSIHAIAPPHPSGTVDIQVSTPGGSSNITSADHFTYGGP